MGAKMAIVQRHNRKAEPLRMMSVTRNLRFAKKTVPKERDCSSGTQETKRALSTHPSRGYCLGGCTPAEPSSSSPGDSQITPVSPATQIWRSTETRWKPHRPAGS